VRPEAEVRLAPGSGRTDAQRVRLRRRRREIRHPNHLAFLPDGSLFVTDSGAFREVSGKIFRFDGSGNGEVWHPGPFNFANGIAIGPKGDAVYVVCSWLPGVERIEIRSDGSAGKRSVHVKLPKLLPDGLAFDARGNLYVTCYTPARILKISRDRKVSVSHR
jgi:sugar lactone lactonase YvrE